MMEFKPSLQFKQSFSHGQTTYLRNLWPCLSKELGMGSILTSSCWGEKTHQCVCFAVFFTLLSVFCLNFLVGFLFQCLSQFSTDLIIQFAWCGYSCFLCVLKKQCGGPSVLLQQWCAISVWHQIQATLLSGGTDCAQELPVTLPK